MRVWNGAQWYVPHWRGDISEYTSLNMNRHLPCCHNCSHNLLFFLQDSVVTRQQHWSDVFGFWNYHGIWLVQTMNHHIGVLPAGKTFQSKMHQNRPQRKQNLTKFQGGEGGYVPDPPTCTFLCNVPPPRSKSLMKPWHVLFFL